MSADIIYYGQAETNAETWFNKSLRPRKPEGSLGRTAQDGHLDSHTSPGLTMMTGSWCNFSYIVTNKQTNKPHHAQQFDNQG